MLKFAGHPYEPMLAVSGIDHTVKIFSPDVKAQYDARDGLRLGISATGSSGYSSLAGFGRTRRRPQRQPETQSQDTGTGEGENALNPRGLRSRRRMQDEYEIISQNDVARRGGLRDAYITVGAASPSLRRMTITFATWAAMFGNDQ
jgi:nuclear receptor interaction protein